MTDHSLTPEAESLICTELQKAFPNALGIYAFGSRVQGTANAQSDLDLAVLVAGYAAPLQLFEMANQLADKLGYEVDLLDLRTASTVMQYQVITTGRRLWAKDDKHADWFEILVTKEKWDLDELREKKLNKLIQLELFTENKIKLPLIFQSSFYNTNNLFKFFFRCLRMHDHVAVRSSPKTYNTQFIESQLDHTKGSHDSYRPLHRSLQLLRFNVCRY